MILNDFLVLNDSGLYCRYGDFYLDPVIPVSNALVSHAHGDHAVKGNVNVFCTPPTSEIMIHRYHKNAARNFFLYKSGESFEVGGVQVSFLSAGHILGSVQVLMKYEGVRYLYTGDYKLQEDRTCEPIDFEIADVLITETTFADPEIKHPDPVEEIRKLNTTPHNILLGAYSLGKAQRLVNLISLYCPEKKVLVHHSVLGLNKIYEKFGFHPGNYEPYNRKLMKQPDQNYIYIVPPLTFNSYFRATNVLRAFASGWKKLQAQNDIQLFISDHVDWNDILYMLGKTQPQEVWTLHGDGRHLERHFKGTLKIKLLNVC